MQSEEQDPNEDLIGFEFDNEAEGTRWRVASTWMLDSYVLLECVGGDPDQRHSETRIIGAAVIRNRKLAGV